ncbi:hypothetical protein [Methylopila turkensis]|uniref:Uncharacterized protein n=1 Tax=Methylopila turkensis TaxID=1437816 RepID=A0A9W6N8G6_9HYPH|nr:hypothetical protein [Methylopila turkensis]GLK81402.1 hypothetical protein GCM10008174_31430 [Methylopila turkensis]
MPRIALISAGLAAALALGAGVYLLRASAPARVETAAAPAAPTASPEPAGPPKVALYCQFYVFVESRPFVAFLFDQSPEDRGLYRQVYVAKADGDRTDYNAATGGQPEWRFIADVEPPRIVGRVTVPDNSQAGVAEQDIAIELREGFDAARADQTWYEASLKSIYYQNLPGKCRQAAA